MKPYVAAIAAMSNNGIIGVRLQTSGRHSIPWVCGEDLKHFRGRTTGHVVVMGRTTYESIGYPLPNRVNVVLSKVVYRQGEYNVNGRTLYVFDDFERVLEWCEKAAGELEIWVIGGKEVYEATMSHWKCLELTRLDLEVPDAAAVHMPDFGHLVESSRLIHEFAPVMAADGSIAEPGGRILSYTMKEAAP